MESCGLLSSCQAMIHIIDRSCKAGTYSRVIEQEQGLNRLCNRATVLSIWGIGLFLPICLRKKGKINVRLSHIKLPIFDFLKSIKIAISCGII